MFVLAYGVELVMSPPDSRGAPTGDIMAEIVELAEPVDIAKEILVFESAESAADAEALLDRHDADYEKLRLLKLSPTASNLFKAGALYEDYAIDARSGNVYFDLHLVAAFRLTKTKPDAEPAPALLQLEEHLIGTLSSDEGTLHLIDKQLAPLADRVARAYGCTATREY
ncbi:MAG: hypothetical protein J7559_07255 [Cohnella sp.]|nr:hypothetical protein [Cohnella sp.]